MFSALTELRQAHAAAKAQGDYGHAVMVEQAADHLSAVVSNFHTVALIAAKAERSA